MNYMEKGTYVVIQDARHRRAETLAEALSLYNNIKDKVPEHMRRLCGGTFVVPRHAFSFVTCGSHIQVCNSASTTPCTDTWVPQLLLSVTYIFAPIDVTIDTEPSPRTGAAPRQKSKNHQIV